MNVSFGRIGMAFLVSAIAGGAMMWVRDYLIMHNEVTDLRLWGLFTLAALLGMYFRTLFDG